jgi:hypothetical protein
VSGSEFFPEKRAWRSTMFLRHCDHFVNGVCPHVMRL